MSDLLTDIHRDISARLEQLRPAVTEYTRLQEAQAALADTGSTARGQRAGPNASARSAVKSVGASSRRRNTQRVSSPPSSSAQGRSGQPAQGRRRTKRAPRGANQAAVVAALRKHGRVTVPELAKATKIKPGVLYALTRVLVDKGVLSTEKTNGRRAFALTE
jgi:hypothetical protein